MLYNHSASAKQKQTKTAQRKHIKPKIAMTVMFMMSLCKLPNCRALPRVLLQDLTDELSAANNSDQFHLELNQMSQSLITLVHIQTDGHVGIYKIPSCLFVYLFKFVD